MADVLAHIEPRRSGFRMTPNERMDDRRKVVTNHAALIVAPGTIGSAVVMNATKPIKPRLQVFGEIHPTSPQVRIERIAADLRPDYA